MTQSFLKENSILNSSHNGKKSNFNLIWNSNWVTKIQSP